MIASDFLASKRAEKGLTRRAVARELCITEQTVYMMETNPDSNPTAMTISKLADFYGCSIDEILGRDTPQEEPAQESRVR